MKISILIENEVGEPIFTANNNTVEMAVQELYRFERNHEKDLLTAEEEVEPETI